MPSEFFLPAGVLPMASMVVIAEVPTLSMVVLHERVATPPELCRILGDEVDQAAL